MICPSSQVTSRHPSLAYHPSPGLPTRRTRTCVLEGPTARRGTLMSKPLLGSFSPRRAGSLKGSCPVSQSHTVFRMACRTLNGRQRSADPSGSSSHSTCSPHTQLSEHPSLGVVGGQGNGPGQCGILRIDCSLGDITSPRSSEVAAIFISSPRNDVLSSEHRVPLRAGQTTSIHSDSGHSASLCQPRFLPGM